MICSLRENFTGFIGKNNSKCLVKIRINIVIFNRSLLEKFVNIGEKNKNTKKLLKKKSNHNRMVYDIEMRIMKEINAHFVFTYKACM